MHVLHSADWHIGELSGPTIDGHNARLLDTLKCIDFLVERAIAKQPDAILISGDLFDKSKLWGDNMLFLIDEAVARLRALAGIAPTVLMFGTANHDSLKAFGNIDSMRIPNLHVLIQPSVFAVNTEHELLQIATLPGFDKGYFRAQYPGMAPEEENKKCSQLLGDMVLGLGAQIDASIPSVLMSHYTVVGCELDNGEHVFSQSDIVLPAEALAASPFDFVCLGHIHRAQQVPVVGKQVYYSGALNGLTFNEEGQDKGFWMHEIAPNWFSSEFIKTPHRKFWTIRWNDEDIQGFLNGKWPMNPDYIKDKIIRIHYSCSDELNKQLNRRALEKSLYEAGAFHVSEIKPTQIVTALVKQDMSENSGPLENLLAWVESEGMSDEETLALFELARPLVATVSAKMPTGTLNGVFEPKRLEVKNYRSYQSEEFDFQKIFFATVNGPNGIGKSAFFMDSISDCLYEEPRSGETGSWITNGQTDGMMTFEFSMGETDWRVVRTRSIKGGGKITLNLSENINGKWEDRSGTTAKQTQEKIVALLGMDCATFRCTALIMQDAYGLFMEANKEQRMEVLANILGLNVYEQLTDLAKARVTEINRQLAITKAKLSELDEKLKGKAELETDLIVNESDLKQVAEDIAGKERELRTAEDLVRTLQAKGEKANELSRQIKALEEEVAGRRREIEQRQRDASRAQQMLDSETKILAKALEFENVKEQITILKTKEPKFLELKGDRKKTQDEVETLQGQINKLKEQISPIERLFANKTELDSAAVEYQAKITELEKMETLGAKDAELYRLIMDAERDLDKNADEYNSKQTFLIELHHKAAMLDNSSCIDSVNAKCAFLSDAQKAKMKITEVEKEIEALKEAHKPLAERAINFQSQRDALGYDSQKHYDLRQVANSLRPKAELAGQLETKAELLTSLKDSFAQAVKRSRELGSRMDEIDITSETLRKELEPLSGLIERLPKLEAWTKAKEELPAARQMVTTSKDLIAGIERDIEVKENHSRKLEEERQALLAEVAGLSDAELNAQKYRDDLKWLQSRQNEFHAAVGAVKARLEALAKDEEERRNLANEMEPTAKELVWYQTLAKAFGFDGIPFSVVRSVVPELSAMSNDILGQMTGGKMALEMRTERIQKSSKKEVNALEVWIMDWRGNIPYKDRSGGQKVKAALANAFALADLKARRAGIQLGMMFVDEPPFLDEEGIETYCDALELLSSRYPNMRVIAISHDPRMKARFPQQIDVLDMGNEGSKVRIAC